MCHVARRRRPELVSMWTIIFHRYRSYLYLIAAIVAVPVLIVVIKQYVQPENQIYWAAGSISMLFVVIILSVPYNYFQAALNKFIQLQADDAVESFDFPIDTEGDFDVVSLDDPDDPVTVDGVLIHMEEVVVPLKKEYDFSHVLSKIGKSRYIAFRYHGKFTERFDFGDLLVYFNGTPFQSRNGERVNGFFIDVNTVIREFEYGPMPVVFVKSTLNGDQKLNQYPEPFDAFWAAFWKAKKSEQDAIEAAIAPKVAKK